MLRKIADYYDESAPLRQGSGNVGYNRTVYRNQESGLTVTHTKCYDKGRYSLYHKVWYLGNIYVSRDF